MLPRQLQNAELRFTKIRRFEKRPVETGWQLNGYRFDDPSFLAWVKRGENYGVLTGDGLVVIDCDVPEFADALVETLPPTFTVATPRGGLHLYYFVEGEKCER